MKRALPFIIAAVVALLALLGALGVNSMIGSAVAPEPERLAALQALDTSAAGAAAATSADTPPPAPRVRARSGRDYIDAILKRNIFDAEFIDTYKPNTGSDLAASDQITDLKVRLLGTVVAEPETFSSALIAQESSEDRPIGYGIGDRISDAEIVAIEKKKVTLRRGNGSIEYLVMDDDQPTERRAPSTSSESSGDDSDGVEKLGENKFAVDRSLIDKYLTDMDAISRMGRALLHRGPDGEFDGYRLSAIRRNTLADQLGIRNGDVVHNVNGQALNSVQGAMGAYQGLQNENNFTFEITRRGERVTLEYEVR